MTDLASAQSGDIAPERLNRSFRGIVSLLASLLTLAAIGWAANFYAWVGLALYNEQFLAVILGLVLPLAFLTAPFKKGDTGKLPWYDAVAALLGFATSLYVYFDYPDLANELAYQPWNALVAAIILLLLIVEGVRRTAGPVLVVILFCFFVYAMWGHYIPGRLVGREIDTQELLIGLALDPQALFGAPFKIATTVVISFLFMGQILNLSGGAKFFTGLAMSAMGQYRGGGAKIAVVASSLFGSISGSAVSNVASTGVVTIPMMRDSGYSKESAGAIEAVASTGGQLMPPLMGASAFVMAEFLEIPYAEVVLAALIPAVLYYLALFVLTDLEAAKSGIVSIPADQLPKMKPILRAGWFFPLPFGVLIYALFGANLLPETSALYASVTLFGLVAIFGYDGKRAGLKLLLRALKETGMSCIELLLIVAVAGLVIGLLNTSGLGFALTYTLVQIGGGNLALLVVLAAIICVILGMGMPTLGVYVLVAALVAPSLVEVGIKPIAAHLFVLYFGMMSMITPPVAIAAFAAASISRADPMKTGFEAVRFGWLAYLIPFLFILSPSLLMQGSPSEILYSAAITVIGVWFISVGLIGYFVMPIGVLKRLAFIAAGLVSMSPAVLLPAPFLINLAGILAGGLLIAFEWHNRPNATLNN
jgi:TRAP transporter 4TM/12TM fusion protein